MLNGWERPSETLTLRPDEAHIWMVRTDPESVDVRPWMHALRSDERERAERFTHAAGRSGFVVARSALRHLLGRYLDVEPDTIELQRTAAGKPELSGAHAAVLRFSVAHSGGVALLSFATVDVGVDVERVRPVARAGRIVARVFSESMRERLAGVRDEDWRDAFFAAWTQREALVKAVGGVMMATRDPLEFAWPPPPAPHVLTEPGGATWTVARLPQPEGYAAAFVAAGDVRTVRLFEYPFQSGFSR